MSLLGAVLGGGTNFEAAVGRMVDDQVVVEDRTTLPTGTPEQTLPAIAAWLDERGAEPTGFACFGPLDRDRGRMLATPKGGWEGTDLRQPISGRVVLETDVNAAAIAEQRWGAGRGHHVVAYVTVGTGVGGGLSIAGAAPRGPGHSEMGHLPALSADPFEGACPFHGNCVEGLIAGPALFARTGVDPAALPSDHPVWKHVGTHLGDLAGTILLTTGATCVVFGGGVVRNRTELLAGAKTQLAGRLQGYLQWLRDDAIKVAELDRPGLFGAFALAARL